MPKLSPSIFGRQKFFRHAQFSDIKIRRAEKIFGVPKILMKIFIATNFFRHSKKFFRHAQFFFQHAEKIFDATNFFSEWRKFFGHDEFFFGAPKILMKFSARRKKLGAPKNSARKTNRVMVWKWFARCPFLTWDV